MLEDSWAAAGGRQGAIAVDNMVLPEGRCAPTPPRSQPSGGDCHLTQDMCVWSGTARDERRQQRWRRAEPLAALAPRVTLADLTLRDAAGSVCCDLFRPQELRQPLRLVSPLMEPRQDGGGGACVSF